tara:strand:- start:2825 stop:3619 length:795 start_codon:yes stop_codon:yes gene_type:complete
MDMGRLFTFGCSFTKYIYPTWADFIGTQFDIHQNWGKLGAGNFFIYSQLLECNQLNNINKDDTVLIMLSSYIRFDLIDRKSNFVNSGNMYNQKFFDEDFVYNKWSEEYGFYSTWAYVNSIINFLKSVGCKYKILNAFDITKREGDTYAFDDFSKPRFKNCLEYLKTVCHEVDLYSYSKQKNENGIPHYKFKEDGDFEDYHPTISMHHDFVKEYLTEFYDQRMLNHKDEWETKIDGLKSITISNFDEQLYKSKYFNTFLGLNLNI